MTRQRRDVAPIELEAVACGLIAEGYRLALVAGHDDGDGLRVVYLFLAPIDRRVELTVRLPVGGASVPSLVAHSFAAGRFERELQDLFGIVPASHPRPVPLVKHAHWPADYFPMRRGAGPMPEMTNVGGFPFSPVEGTGVYEIPVGPIHAGMIEPGHFRFSVVGETIVKMTARLWFVHRGIEKLFEGRPALGSIGTAEVISGDTSVGHGLAYVQAVEDAVGLDVAEPARRLRALVLELERLYNHVCDLGAMANDVGLGIAHAHCQALREQLLRLNDTVTGHRLLRGAVVPGGVQLRTLPAADTLRAIAEEAAEIVALTLRSSVVRDRFTGTAALTRDQSRELGCLGYVARASGVSTDARLDHPVLDLPVQPFVQTSGDVMARYLMRRDEIAASAALAVAIIEGYDGPLEFTPSTILAHQAAMGVGIVEGWRGTIVHRVEVDPDGTLTRVKVVDPSWFNWPALAVALNETIVPDFPLANKSFNLSYAGNDL